MGVIGERAELNYISTILIIIEILAVGPNK